jgi:hypothetical protein
MIFFLGNCTIEIEKCSTERWIRKGLKVEGRR